MLRLLVLAFSAIALAPSAQAQQSCEEVAAVVLQCPDLQGIAGSPPDCFCNGALVPNQQLTCAINFGCATGDEIGFGEWPNCGCRPREEIVPPGGGGGEPGGGGSVGGGLGGVDTCNQFFDCPGGFEMGLQQGQCVCVGTMQPAFPE